MSKSTSDIFHKIYHRVYFKTLILNIIILKILNNVPSFCSYSKSFQINTFLQSLNSQYPHIRYISHCKCYGEIPGFVSSVNEIKGANQKIGFDLSRRWHYRHNLQSSYSDLGEGLPKYCEDLYSSKRFPTRSIKVGPIFIGSRHKIATQTMTTSDTKDFHATVDQIIKCADSGADLVRITVQGTREASAAGKIREELFRRKYDIPIVADIHFTPKIALMVADSVEKIRVNPGNFADGAKKWENDDYSDADQFEEGRKRIESHFVPLVEKCKKLNRAIRIGTNHGSLSARILSFYGDTPRGMVESAFEFAEICRELDFHNFCFSMKSSNPIVMTQAYRLLISEQIKRKWDYPVHLGVTEAGEGEDGRIKSAIGVGSLLNDGIGDTIRVSLTEDPWIELNACKYLAKLAEKDHLSDRSRYTLIPPYKETTRHFYETIKRNITLPTQIITDDIDVRGILHRDGSVITRVTSEQLGNPDKLYDDLGCKVVLSLPFKEISTSDSVYLDKIPSEKDQIITLKRLMEANMGIIVDIKNLNEFDRINQTASNSKLENFVGIVDLEYIMSRNIEENLNSIEINFDSFRNIMGIPRKFIRYGIKLYGDESDAYLNILNTLKRVENPVMIILDIKSNLSYMHASRRIFDFLNRNNLSVPVIHSRNYSAEKDLEEISLECSKDVGSLLIDKLGDGILLSAGNSRTKETRIMSFAILQASRMRNTKTEFISCPSCGRTLFNIQEVTEEIRNRTGHLPGVSIAVMGCIVNGVGEMADADFGYVGGAPGKVDLYVGKTLVQRGIPNKDACDSLIELIKKHGKWVEKDDPDEVDNTDTSLIAGNDLGIVKKSSNF